MSALGKPVVSPLPPGWATGGAGPEPFLTKEEVAPLLRVQVRTLELWMDRGVVPFFKSNVAVRFRWTVIQQHWDAHYLVCRRRVPIGECCGGKEKL